MRSVHHIIPCLIALCSVVACAQTDADEQRVLDNYEDTGADAIGDVDAGASTDADSRDADPADLGAHDVDVQDGGSDSDTAQPPDADPVNGGLCQPVGDGIMRRDRYPFEVGASAPYKFSLDVDIDTQGQMQGDERTWDLSADLGDDFVDDVRFEDPDDHWFGEEFPQATYAAELSSGDDDELGLFQVTDDALLLIGVASPDDGFNRTELSYDPPVTILSFPFQEGDQWETETRASGSYGGNHVHGHDETYVTDVDASGELTTPYGTFPVLRINTWLEQEVWMGGLVWVTTEIRTHTFASECFGTVARITSEDDDADPEFDRAAQVMRLAQ